MQYTVKYKVDVNADTPRQAALEVEDILKNGDYRPHLIVADEQGLTSFIDLETDAVLPGEKEYTEENNEEYEERIDGNKHIEILQHDISYWYRDTELNMGEFCIEHIENMINQGISEGELNMTDPENPNETFRGYWEIAK